MKYIQLYALFLMSVFYTSCEQNQVNVSKVKIKSEIKDTVNAYGPKTMVRNIKNGRNGTILIAASFGGVFRYDGKSFINLTSKIGSRRFWDVLEDRRGNLWFSSTDSGVYYYNGKSFRHFTTRNGLVSNQASQIYEDKTGNIWFGTAGGVSRYDGKSFRNFTKKDGLPNNDITAILKDKSGKLWFGSSGEACFYDGKKFTVLRNKDGKAFNNVRGLIEDKKGNIWFGGSIIEDKKDDTLFVSDGLWRYDGSTFTKVTQRGASAIIEDKKGNIWTTGAVKPNGDWVLSRYDQKSLYSKNPIVTEIRSKYEGSKGMLCGILEANDGSILYGSFFGVYRYDGETITDFKSKEGQK